MDGLAERAGLGKGTFCQGSSRTQMRKTPLQVVNAYGSIYGTGLPDLLAINGDPANGYYHPVQDLRKLEQGQAAVHVRSGRFRRRRRARSLDGYPRPASPALTASRTFRPRQPPG